VPGPGGPPVITQPSQEPSHVPTVRPPVLAVLAVLAARRPGLPRRAAGGGGLGSIAQTQITLNALVALDVALPWGLRGRTTLQDLVAFGPVYAGMVFVAWLPAFAIAGWLARRAPRWRGVLFTLAGGAALAAAFACADAVAPMPVFIDATRGVPGTLAMVLGGVLGGALYARWTRTATPVGVRSA
jgi:hypothetical protein